MEILSCAPFNSAFNKINCCVCEREMKLNSTLSYVCTKSGLFLCQDCLDRLARENRRILSNFEEGSL